MTERLDLTGIEVYARHGVFESEKEAEQLFRIDLQVTMDLAPAAESDDLADTLDYGTLARDIHDLVAGERHDLIETVADRVAWHILEDRRVERVVVTVHKPQAPIPVPFSDIAVTIERNR